MSARCVWRARRWGWWLDMQVTLKLDGLDEVKRTLAGLQKQVNYAASRALNSTAFAINGRIKNEMQSVFKGGPTAYTQRAFEVLRANKDSLQASVKLRTDAPSGGTSYDKSLRHLFTGGTRDWKRLEGYLRGRGFMASGSMAAPGSGIKLDSRGNISKSVLTEMLGVINTNRTNLRVYRKTGAGKAQKAVGYFVVRDTDKGKLKPGIYKRIETGSSSAISSMIMFVRPGNWRKFIDLEAVGKEIAQNTFNAEFEKEMANAIRSAK